MQLKLILVGFWFVGCVFGFVYGDDLGGVCGDGDQDNTGPSSGSMETSVTNTAGISVTQVSNSGVDTYGGDPNGLDGEGPNHGSTNTDMHDTFSQTSDGTSADCSNGDAETLTCNIGAMVDPDTYVVYGHLHYDEPLCAYQQVFRTRVSSSSTFDALVAGGASGTQGTGSHVQASTPGDGSSPGLIFGQAVPDNDAEDGCKDDTFDLPITQAYIGPGITFDLVHDGCANPQTTCPTYDSNGVVIVGAVECADSSTEQLMTINALAAHKAVLGVTYFYISENGGDEYEITPDGIISGGLFENSYEAMCPEVDNDCGEIACSMCSAEAEACMGGKEAPHCESVRYDVEGAMQRCVEEESAKACGISTEESSEGDSDEEEEEDEEELKIYFTPSQINDEMEVNVVKDSVIKIKNNMDEKIDFRLDLVDIDDDFLVNIEPSKVKFTLDSGESIEVPINYSSKIANTYSGKICLDLLEIIDDCKYNAKFNVEVTKESSANFIVSPSSAVIIANKNESLTTSFEITNTGTSTYNLIINTTDNNNYVFSTKNNNISLEFSPAEIEIKSGEKKTF